MKPARTLVAATAVTFALVTSTASAAEAHRPPAQPTATRLATFGSGLGSGSTIGPDRALYVTDGNAGAVIRIDPRTGTQTTYASGLPRQVLGIGGAIDVAFIGRTAYVLVTMVGGDLLLPSGTVHFGDATDGIYRLEPDGTFTVVADIGTWAQDHPPTGDYFISTGVQYAMQPYKHGFAVTDGHHNRLLHVSLTGAVTEQVAFANDVPTGLETDGRTIYVAQAGPVPHGPSDARIVAVTNASSPRVVAAGTTGPGLTVDVERGPHGLYALLQGVWDLPPDPANAGAPASPNTGALVAVDDGTYTTIVDQLDRPTSLEIAGDTAYVVTLTGTVLRIDHLGRSHRANADDDAAD